MHSFYLFNPKAKTKIRSTLSANTTAAENTAVGYVALSTNTTGGTNSAFGRGALQTNTTGSSNVAVGTNALGENTTGSYNTAVGTQSGDSVTTGYQNALYGWKSGDQLNVGYCNTMIGVYAGHTNTSGYCNTYIGRDARGDASDTNNQVVIGTVVTGKGTQTAFIAGTSGAYNGANSSTWSTTSDRRIKKNIVDNTIGLDKINQIQVRNFEYRTPDEITELPKHSAIDKQGIQVGVIAQEIEEILPDVVKEETTGVKSVNPDNITWYLVKAIQELKAENDSLKTRIEILEG